MFYKMMMITLFFPALLTALPYTASITYASSKRSVQEDSGEDHSQNKKVSSTRPDLEPQILEIQQVRPEERTNAILTQHLIIAPTFAEDVKTLFQKKLIDASSSRHEEYQTKRRLKYEHSIDLNLLRLTDYSVFLRESSELIGIFNFDVGIHQEGGPNAAFNNTIETDIALIPKYQGKGYGTEMLRAVSELIILPLLGQYPKVHWFYRQGDDQIMSVEDFPIRLTQVIARIRGRNTASKKLHAKCGWRQIRTDEHDYAYYVYEKVQ
jgi:RimJ/RimL family protein N-acetyltransferase